MKTTPRLHLEAPLLAGGEIILSREQGHYLTGVLRLASGDAVRAFNGRDGEWLAYLATVSKKTVSLRCERRVAEAKLPPDIDYIFAPLKHARLDYVVQKATELGARRLRPVMTSRTVAERVNLDRMRANVIEAAEQCNLVHVPEVLEPEKLEKILATWEKGRSLVYCDETMVDQNPLESLRSVRRADRRTDRPRRGLYRRGKSPVEIDGFCHSHLLGPPHHARRYGSHCGLDPCAGLGRGLGNP